jgi:hypothetical protein
MFKRNITIEDIAAFIGAASAAQAAGKKKFKLGDKEYPVTISKDVAKKVREEDVADFIGAASAAKSAGKEKFKFGDKEYPVTISDKVAKAVKEGKMPYVKLKASEYMESVKESTINELTTVDREKLVKVFDKLKKGSTVKIKSNDSIKKGDDYIEFVVKSKSTVRRGEVEKITLANKGNPTGVNRFLYKRVDTSTVSFAVGDMAASIVDIKESTELDEAIDFRKAFTDIQSYAKKSGGIDKTDFEKVAYYVKAIGDNQNTPNVANKAFMAMKNHIAGLDTDVRDGIHVLLKKHGMVKNGRMVQESITEGALGKQWVNGAKMVKSGSITLVKAKNPDADLHTVMKNGKKVGTFVYDDGPDAFSVTNMSTKKVSWADQIDDIPKMFESKAPVDEVSKEGTVRIIDLGNKGQDKIRKELGVDKLPNKGFQVQVMTKGKFVNQGKPYKTMKDAEKVRSTGQHSMQFDEAAFKDKFAKKEEMEKVECPECEGKGCDHCDGKGYHEVEKEEYNLDGRTKAFKEKLQKLMYKDQGKKVLSNEKEFDGRQSAFKEKLKKLGYRKEDVTTEEIFNKILEDRLEEAKSSTGYELYHKDFSSAMQHAYDFAKKKFGIEIDPEEIDDKVAMGPRKPSNGKTNSYRLMGTDERGKSRGVQIQVANLDNKRYELNMYKEEAEVKDDVEEAMLPADKAKRLKMIRQAVEKMNKSNMEKAKKDALTMMKDSGMFDEELEEAAPKIKGSNPKLKNGIISSIRGKDGRVYDVELQLDRRGIRFRTLDDMGTLNTIDLRQASKIFEDLENLNEKKYSKKQYKMAFGVLNDPRWKGGSMTQIVNTIEKIATGLSDDPAVSKAIQITNEEMIGRPLMAQHCMEEFQLTESIIDDMRDIVDNKQAKKIKGTMVDLFTASAVVQIYDKVNDSNKSKMENLPLPKLVDLAYKIMQREEINEINTIIENADKKDAKEMEEIVREINPKYSMKEIKKEVEQMAMEKYGNKSRAIKIASYIK